MSNTTIAKFTKDIDNLSRGNPWYGKSYEQILNDVDATMAFTEHPLYSIAELLGHTISWRSYVLNIIQDLPGGLDDDHPDNWRSNAVLKSIGWPVLQLQFYTLGDKITEALQSKTDAWLSETFVTHWDRTSTYHYLLQGMMQHDVYHLGQIAQMKKLIASK